jgi:hypothetical protein
MICNTLSKAQRTTVQFDPNNVEHMEAFRLLCLGEPSHQGVHIKQHPTLRFALENSFPDVRSMMFHKVGEYHRTQLLKRKAKRTAVA